MRVVSNLRIGWIIGNQLEEARFFHRINVNIGGISLVRYHWIAAQINALREYNLKYEIYRPWKKFDALIFLKSMGEKSLALIEKYHRINRPLIFDANVDYYTIWGNEYYGDTATIAVHIQKIRKKIESDPANPAYIETLWGTGYRFNP